MNNLVTTPNTELLSRAKDRISGKWGEALLAGIVYMLVSSVSGFIPFGSILIGGALLLGWVMWSLAVVRNGEFKVETIFAGFNDFTRSLGTYLLMMLIVLLYTLLLIIPGIIKALAYSQAFYIMADDPEISSMDALRKSEQIMKGNKTKLFLMYMIFFLLSLLSVFTLFIGLLFLVPFMQVVLAEFYEEINQNLNESENELESIGEE